mmetsp:Transcript_36860/g.48416  ORF Transcript_36860/g.48416 Transcript_36860/m.48416 type:complete len:92 (-) Transcript_36860:76-351(-)
MRLASKDEHQLLSLFEVHRGHGDISEDNFLNNFDLLDFLGEDDIDEGWPYGATTAAEDLYHDPHVMRSAPSHRGHHRADDFMQDFQQLINF